MADIFRGTLKKREEAAELAPPPRVLPPPQTGGVRFGKQFTPEEKAKQAAKLAEILRNR
jgi:hypothetical protein